VTCWLWPKPRNPLSQQSASRQKGRERIWRAVCLMGQALFLLLLRLRKNFSKACT
jgi:hypothetical protein